MGSGRSTQRKRVLVLESFPGHYNREILRGVARYARHHGNWLIAYGASAQAARQIIRTSRVEGVLFRGSDLASVRRLIKVLRVPAVEYDQRSPFRACYCTSSDHEAAGCMAALYLTARGFRQFGGYGTDAPDFRRRRQGFQNALAQAGLPCSVLETRFVPAARWSHRQRVAELRRWLSTLKTPAAVLLGDDATAPRIAEACDALQLRIPEDIALIGVGNDEVECELVWPMLTSVDLGAERVGFSAAELLDRLMSGGTPPESPIMIPPLRIVERGSTDVLAVEDEAVAAALRLIRERCPQPVGGAELSAQAGVSRRTLETRFRRLLETSPAAEVRRQRMVFAKDMLLSSNTKVVAVAAACHYRSLADLVVTFRKATGLTPTAFRSAHQRRGQVLPAEV
ncbi:MAG: XylR family transcriptional regulator [Kiritimatiellae bacterium]|nr:XylR family transcriptional regulator [Kiritimatiellia bacterium]